MKFVLFLENFTMFSKKIFSDSPEIEKILYFHFISGY